MSPLPPRPRRRTPLWTIPALVAFLALPAGVGPPVLAAVLLGSAAWSIVRAVRSRRPDAAMSARPGDVPLGHADDGRPVVLAERQLAAHGLILGASGAGKTTSLLRILTARIRAGEPVVAVDMKASPRFEGALRAACEAAGRPLLVWRPEGPVGWNPLAHGNATERKDRLIAAERFSEPHYKRQAERYLQLALGVLAESHPERAPDLAEVIDVLEPQRLARMAAALPAGRATRIADYLATLGPDGMSAVRGLATRLALLAESHAGPFLRESAGAGGSIDLRGGLDGEAVVLFSLNSSSLRGLAAQLGTLAVQDLISACGERLSGGADAARLATVGIDEFSGLGGDHIEHLLARGRESGVSVMLATQELADLERAGRGFSDQVVGVTALKVIHRQDVPASALKAAEMAGHVEVWEETERFGAGGPLGQRTRAGGTRRVVERHRIHPDTIASLRTGEAVVITKIPSADVRLVRVEPPSGDVRSPAVERPGPAPGADDRRNVGDRRAAQRAARRAAALSGSPRQSGIGATRFTGRDGPSRG